MIHSVVDFFCVYISGADADKLTKLLGVPEVVIGSGKDQKDVAVEMMTKWNILCR